MRHASAFLIGLTLIACTSDKDKDGFTSDVDCNDNNPEVYPGAPELCNSIDDDCDGVVDNDAGDTWYVDADDDGYGDSDDSTQACQQPSGFVANADDCDDTDDRFHPGASEDDCTDPNDYNCDGSVGYADADEDGFAACEDCDDSRSDVNPSADEVCDEVDNDCDGLIDSDDGDVVDASTYYIDYDGDGYGSESYVVLACSQPDGFVENSDDCDDARAESYPGAVELCDGYDNDCDGEVDEDAGDLETYWADVDGDGYGDAAEPLEACAQPDDYVDNDGDCDDSDDGISPAADEICDGIDNDCDDLVDDDDSDTLYSSDDLRYLDEDGDGYGAYGIFVLACELPDGYVDEPGDCDDEDPAVNPDAVEYCDGIDNNCVDGIDEDSAADATTWYIDEDEDDYGLDSGTTVACEQPAGYAPVADDCDDEDDAVNPSAVEICNDGIDNDCDSSFEGCVLSLSDADVILTGEASLDDAAISFAGLGDIDGDGYDDLAVGARDNDQVATDAGATYVIYGPLSSGTVSSLGDATTIIRGADSTDRMGRFVAAGYDVDGDGVNDLISAAPNDEEGGASTGSVFVYSGVDLLAGGELGPSDAFAAWYGEDIYDYLGVRVDMGELTGDGVADVIASANGGDADGTNSGSIYVFAGPISAGTTDLGSSSSWTARLTGENASDAIGQSVGVAGDFDGDGNDDMLVGVVKDNSAGTSAGAAYLVLGPLSGDLSLSAADVKLLGDSAGVEFGNTVSFLGDQDGDGYDEIVVGAHLDNGVGSDAGAAYIFEGLGAPTTLDGGSASSSASASIWGPTTGHQLASYVDGGGDFDGDGTRDLLVSASGAGSSGQGTSYLFTGPLSGSLGVGDALGSFVGENADDNAGAMVGFVGDVTGMGTDVIGIGAIANDRAGTDAGALYLVFDIGL